VYPVASSNQFDFFNLTDNLKVFIHLLTLANTNLAGVVICYARFSSL
jgi:uncharacterized membrane protein